MKRKRFVVFEQHDCDSCGAAALCTALTPDYDDPDYGSLLEDLHVYKTMLMPNGTLPSAMAEVANRYYEDLVPLTEIVVGDHGVALEKNLAHWVAFYFKSKDRIEIMDPMDLKYSYTRAGFGHEYVWGLGLRNKGVGRFEGACMANISAIMEVLRRRV